MEPKLKEIMYYHRISKDINTLKVVIVFEHEAILETIAIIKKEDSSGGISYYKDFIKLGAVPALKKEIKKKYNSITHAQFQKEFSAFILIIIATLNNYIKDIAEKDLYSI